MLARALGVVLLIRYDRACSKMSLEHFGSSSVTGVKDMSEWRPKNVLVT